MNQGEGPVFLVAPSNLEFGNSQREGMAGGSFHVRGRIIDGYLPLGYTPMGAHISLMNGKPWVIMSLESLEAIVGPIKDHLLHKAPALGGTVLGEVVE